MITLTFPDGSARQFERGLTGAALAASISKSLTKKAVALSLDGRLSDLADPIEADAQVKILTRDDTEALELIRHDAAHVMAEAVQALFPGTQVTIGPMIENGFYYDFYREESFTPDDLAKIEEKMRAIIAADKPFTKEVWSRGKAQDYFAAHGEGFKVELIDTIPKDQDLKIYRQGEWLDLCRGPHMTSTGKIGNAFKLMRLAGAYWRGDHNREQLQRIYGTAWTTAEQLAQHLHRLEEAEKRDHRRLGREMDLFHLQEEAPGAVFWHPKGWTLFLALIDYMRRRQEANGYVEVNSPDMMERKLWEQSGHWEKFGENMFVTETPDERVFCCKPMNCPGHIQIFKNGLKSYRDLPLRIAEFGKVHRYEPSGALHGIMRVRHFTQDDAHIFCTEGQMIEECVKMHNMILSIYSDFGFDDVIIKLSTRPDKRVGSDEVWDLSEAALRTALEQTGLSYEVSPGEGAFYGPKVEYTLRDAIGREWQCGTIQLDFNLPVRLGAFYIGEDGAKHTPVMIHRAMFGSLERFTGILIENYAGHLPLWLAPVQVVVASIVSDANPYVEKIGTLLSGLGIRTEVDTRNEKIGYKIREHQVQKKVPFIVSCGRIEMEEGRVALRIGNRKKNLDYSMSSFLRLIDGLARNRQEITDNLSSKIKGLGPNAERILSSYGVTKVNQIASWTDLDEQFFNYVLMNKPFRYGYREQARISLNSGNETKITKSWFDSLMEQLAPTKHGNYAKAILNLDEADAKRAEKNASRRQAKKGSGASLESAFA